MKTNKKIGIGLVALLIVGGGITAAVLLFSGPRMRNQPSLRAFETSVALPPEHSIPYNINRPAQATDEISKPDSEKGRVYYDYYCVFCHGADGKGNGPVGQSYVPKPADLTATAINNYSHGELYEKSFSGNGHSPVLDKVVPKKYRGPIIAYIKKDLANK